jgi:Cdc6-like AAA superfamily ATPase
LALTRTVLLNAFRPGDALDDPFLFAGRQEQVTELAQNLHVVGVCPIIYGARGLGKTSLAFQAQRIAMGDVTLLGDYGQDQLALGEDDAYLAFYVPCSDSTKDTPAVLQRIINSLSSVVSDDPSEPNQLVDRTTTRRITLKPFQMETIRRYQLPDSAPAYKDLAIDEKLLDIASRLSEASGQRILIIIDELDLVRDTSGLASFIKNASSPDLKFVLVGIGLNISSLLSDHQSIDRIMVPVQVPRMTESELSQIIDRAMEKLRELGVEYTFNRSSSLTLARLASGYPWFVHVLGQQSLLIAHRTSRTTVTTEDIGSALEFLASTRFSHEFRDLYQKAVRDSVKRELVLRTFALWRNQDLTTVDIYPVLRRLGIANSSPYVGHLSSDPFGHVLWRPPLQKRGVLRFTNEMFKVYVRVRRPIFDVDGDIRTAWRAEFEGTDFADDAEPIVRT